jgi:hypothetical protein
MESPVCKKPASVLTEVRGKEVFRHNLKVVQSSDTLRLDEDEASKQAECEM